MASNLFNALVSHLLESSLVGVVVLGLIWVCRGASASLRRTLGIIGLLKFLVPAAALSPVFVIAGTVINRVLQGSPGKLNNTLPDLRLLGTNSVALGAHAEAPVIGGLIIWIVCPSLILIRWIRRTLAHRRELLINHRSISERLAKRLVNVRNIAGVGKGTVAVIESDTEGPGIIGFFSPLLVVPRALEVNLNDSEFESILIHEIVHLKHLDHVWGALRTAVLAIFWFNPVVWLLCRSVALETEKACDEEVIRLTGAPEVYAEGILKTVRLAVGAPDPRFTGAALHSVSSRLKSILDPRPKNESQTMKAIAIATACIAATLSTYANASSDAKTNGESSNSSSDTYDISKLTVVPRILSQARPVYPPDLHSQGVGATILVDFVVDSSGSVQNAFAIKPSNTDFGKSAVDAVSQWKFSPGQVDGHAVATHMQVPIVYSTNADGVKPNS